MKAFNLGSKGYKTPDRRNSAIVNIRNIARCVVAFAIFSLLNPASADAPLLSGSGSGNGGNISDRFIVSILDQFIEQVNSAAKDDSRLVMDQRLRVLKALTGALAKMLDSEITGVRRNSHALGNLSLLRTEWRKNLDEAIQRYDQRTSSKEGNKELYVDAAKSLKREALPHLERLRKSVVVFRRYVNMAHKYASSAESVSETP